MSNTTTTAFPPTQAQINKLYKDVYGPMVIGDFFSNFFMGVVLVIAYKYFTRQKNDHIGNKAVAILVVVLTTLETFFGLSRMIKLCVYHPGDLNYANDLTTRKDDLLQSLLCGLCAVTTQTFMAWKAFSFGHAMKDTYGRKILWISNSVKVLLGLGLVANWALAIYVPIYFNMFPSYIALEGVDLNSQGTFRRLINAQSATLLVVDVLLSIILTFELRNAKTGFSVSNAVLDSVITITLRNGLILTMCQLSQLIVGKTGAITWSSLTFLFISKIYTMTVLSLLIKPKEVHRQWQRRIDAESGSPTNWTDRNIVITGGTMSHMGGFSDNSKDMVSISNTTKILTPPSSMGTLTLNGGYSGALDYSGGSSKDTEDGLMGFRAALMDLEESDDIDEKKDSVQIDVEGEGRRPADDKAELKLKESESGRVGG